MIFGYIYNFSMYFLLSWNGFAVLETSVSLKKYSRIKLIFEFENITILKNSPISYSS